MAQILRTEQNGVEYFTIVATGECAVSLRGLALMSGVPQKTTSRWFEDLSHGGVPKWLEPLRTMPLTLSHEIVKNGKTIKPIAAPAAFKFVSLVARHLKHDRAFETIDLIGEIGLTSYIQSVTGWLPEQYKSAPEAHDRLSWVLDRPDPWKAFYEQAFCDRVFNWFGSKFYWTYIYNQFTPEEACKINRLNPPVNGVRPDKIHQYINPEIKQRLTPYIRELVALANGCTTRQDFELGYPRHFKGYDQLRLFK